MPKASGISSLLHLSLADSRGTQDKWPLARNPDRNWWYRHTTLKLFWPQYMVFWPQQVNEKNVTSAKATMEQDIMELFQCACDTYGKEITKEQ